MLSILSPFIKTEEQARRDLEKEKERLRASSPPPSQTPTTSSPQNQTLSNLFQTTWGKSLQGLFANKSVEDILPRFTIDHLFNPNSPFQQALQQRRGEPMASIQPYPNPSAVPTPQGMYLDDVLSLYAMGFRDSLMRVSPILGSRGIPVFENLMNAPVIVPKETTPAPAPAPAPAPPSPRQLWDKYGVPPSFRDPSKLHLLEDFDRAMESGNYQMAKRLYDLMWWSGADVLNERGDTLEERAHFRNKMRKMMEEMRVRQML